MRFTAAATVAGLAAVVTASPPAYGYGYGAPAMNTTVSSAPAYTTPAAYVTEVVTEYTTYCPGPTQITYGTHTYTVTEATTLTITDCPCTVTKPVYSSVYTTSDCTTATPAPTYPVSSPAPPPYQPPANGTAPPAYQPPATGSYTPPAQTAPPAYTGAASKASFGVAGLLAVVGAVAAL